MGAVKPETRCKHLARDIRPLATHIVNGFSPSVRRICMRREDWQLLLEKPEAARAEGFVIDHDHITYEGIDIYPRDTHAER